MVKHTRSSIVSIGSVITNFYKFMKKIESLIEKENSYSYKIIIERKVEGRTPDAWSEVHIKHWHKPAIRAVITDEDYEKILKILKKYEPKG